jgi:hypothetical protein
MLVYQRVCDLAMFNQLNLNHIWTWVCLKITNTLKIAMLMTIHDAEPWVWGVPYFQFELSRVISYIPTENI